MNLALVNRYTTAIECPRLLISLLVGMLHFAELAHPLAFLEVALINDHKLYEIRTIAGQEIRLTFR